MQGDVEVEDEMDERSECGMTYVKVKDETDAFVVYQASFTLYHLGATTTQRLTVCEVLGEKC